VASEIFCTIPQGVGLDYSFSHWRDAPRWRQSKTNDDTLYGKVIALLCTQANNRKFAGDSTLSDTKEIENHLELMNEVEDKTFHRVANVYDIWEMWQGSQNLRATLKKSSTQNKQMIAVSYVTDTEEIMSPFCSNFQSIGVDEFKVLERLP
jgi:hypothetical protein